MLIWTDYGQAKNKERYFQEYQHVKICKNVTWKDQGNSMHFDSLSNQEKHIASTLVQVYV